MSYFNKHIPYSYYWLFLLIVFSCAKIVSPTGGPKDETPPMVLESSPKQGSVQVNDKTIVLNFDEFVNIVDNSKVLVSPLTNPPPTFKTKGKSVVVSFEEPLKENITYHIRFGDNIVDINERNPLKGYEFVFSTGDKIDSVKVSGKLTPALNDEVVENLLVGLYKESEDTLFTKEPPIYVTRTDEEGNYAINHIAPGRYDLIALEDKNSNNYFDLPNEKIAFVDTVLIFEEKSTHQINLQLFEEDAPLQVLNTIHKVYGQLLVELSGEHTAVTTKWLGLPKLKDSLKVEKVGKDQLDIKYFYQNKMPQKLALLDGGVVFDTISIDETTAKSNTLELSTNLVLSRTNYLEIKDDLIIEGDVFLTKSDLTNSVLQIKDSIELSLSDSAFAFRWEEGKFKIFYDWLENKEYTLHIPPNSFTAFSEATNTDSLSLVFYRRNETAYGDLSFVFVERDSTENYLYQLSKEDGTLIESGMVTDSLLRFEKVLAAKYRFAVIKDANNNGKWDSGNYKKSRQPEKIFLPTSEVSVKPNFETEIEMIIP